MKSSIATGHASARALFVTALILGLATASTAFASSYGGRASSVEIAVGGASQTVTVGDTNVPPTTVPVSGNLTVGDTTVSFGPFTTPGASVPGSSTTVTVPASDTYRINDSGELDAAGGEKTSLIPSVTAAGNTADTARSSTSGSGDIAFSQNYLSRGGISVNGTSVSWDAVSSWASANRFGDDVPGEPEIAGYSRIVNLRVNGTLLGTLEFSYDLTPGANLTYPIPGGRIVFNEHDTLLQSTSGRIKVSAMHIQLDGVADVKVATSFASIAP